jgi:hypothetical protein
MTSERLSKVGRGVLTAPKYHQLKAAEDSRTPKHYHEIPTATTSARFWSAAALCRFVWLQPKR